MNIVVLYKTNTKKKIPNVIVEHYFHQNSQPCLTTTRNVNN